MSIPVSQEYFLNHLVERLKAIDKRLVKVDNVLHQIPDLHEEWNEIRESNLAIEELISAIEND